MTDSEETPPPYDIKGGVGQDEPSARFRSEPQWKMGGRARVPVEAGGHSPGPIYNLPTALEKQVVSKSRSEGKSAPRVSMGRQSRWASHEEELKRNSVPGPGAYG